MKSQVARQDWIIGNVGMPVLYHNYNTLASRLELLLKRPLPELGNCFLSSTHKSSLILWTKQKRESCVWISLFPYWLGVLRQLLGLFEFPSSNTHTHVRGGAGGGRERERGGALSNCWNHDDYYIEQGWRVFSFSSDDCWLTKTKMEKKYCTS